MLLHRMDLVSFLMFRKHLGNLREFLGKWFTAPLAKNCPYAYDAERGITKTKFIKGQTGGGWMAGEAVGFLIKNALPYMAKTSVEMARY